jgi:hypothetical protein
VIVDEAVKPLKAVVETVIGVDEAVMVGLLEAVTVTEFEKVPATDGLTTSTVALTTGEMLPKLQVSCCGLAVEMEQVLVSVPPICTWAGFTDAIVQLKPVALGNVSVSTTLLALPLPGAAVLVMVAV